MEGGRWLLLFLLLATANGAGYRYGVSDQAFYIPVVEHAINPETFPRDASLIDAQGRLMVTDESSPRSPVSRRFRSTPSSWPAICCRSRCSGSRWCSSAAAMSPPHHGCALPSPRLTLRHRIPRTSANSFEPYFHPRMLAFGLGRSPWPRCCGAGCGSASRSSGSRADPCHDGLWFSILIGVALVSLEPRFRVSPLSARWPPPPSVPGHCSRVRFARR